MASTKGKLDDWLVLQTIINEGGFAQAALALGRSQPAISYAIANLQEQLGLKLLKTRGRRAVLTAVGERLLAQARLLLDEHAALTELAASLKDGHEPVLRLAVDSLIPMQWISNALRRLLQQYPSTRVQLLQLDAQASVNTDLILSRQPITGIPSNLLCPLQLVPVAHSEHPLARATTPLSQSQLNQYPQIDAVGEADHRQTEFGWRLQRSDHALMLIQQGLAYGWLPIDDVRTLVDRGELKILMMGEDGRKLIPIYIMHKNRRNGPVVTTLVTLLREITQNRAGLNVG